MDKIATTEEFELTRDMAEALLVFFDHFAEDDVLKVVKDRAGLWFVSSDKRAFLGLARLPKKKPRRLI